MTRPDITATLSHHADEEETIMHGEELEMFEPEEIATTETLPEVLTAAQVTTAELARLERQTQDESPKATPEPVDVGAGAGKAGRLANALGGNAQQTPAPTTTTTERTATA